MKSKFYKIAVALLALVLVGVAVGLVLRNAKADKPGTFEAGKGTFLLNGEPFVVKAAELHYPRIPKEYWEHRIMSCKALGMNTVCLYVFWNIHEPAEGQFNFEGNNDIAEFCRLAQKHDMKVIVRPGPYVCAEWEMGGLPWWLLKKKDIKLRDNDPYFLERVEIFEKEVGKQLADLTIENGGPIIMVQVENEYGSYGINKEYVSNIRDIVRRAGFDKVTLFQCDWASNFLNNGLDDLVWTMNFGTGANIDNQFKKLSEVRPDSPKMCSEFWSGWFDKWGANHETRDAKDMVAGIDEMLSKGISFSLYMTHGGTSFGHWAGANSPGYAPDVTSYDYDAPINEAGQVTPKYHLLREVLAKYSEAELPEIPADMPVITVPKFELNEFKPLVNGIAEWRHSEDIITMEEMDMGWGSMIYSTEVNEDADACTLVVNEAHDFAQIFIDDRYIGCLDRRNHETEIKLPAVKKGERITILVEAMGRINFGRAIKDFKGITKDVTMKFADGSSRELKGWDIATIPDDYKTALAAVKNNKAVALEIPAKFEKRGYYRGSFELKKTGDTFLNFETWGKGQVYVNGHEMGRIWSIGPQQTIYVPGCWLKKGRNEVIVLDVVGPAETVCEGLDKPEVNKLQLDKLRTVTDPSNLEGFTEEALVKAGKMKAGNGWQSVKFDKPVKGSKVAIQAVSAFNSDYVAIAEIYATGADGNRLSREPWTVKYADNEDVAGGNHTGDKVYDLQESTYWSTEKGLAFPHMIVINLGGEQTLTGIDYLPRAEQGAPGSINEYKIYVY